MTKSTAINKFDYAEAIGAHIANHDIQTGEEVSISIHGRHVATVRVTEPMNELVQFEII